MSRVVPLGPERAGANVPTEAAVVAERLEAMAPSLVPGGSGVTGVKRLTAGASQQIWAFAATTKGGDVPLILRRSPGAGNPRTALTVGLTTEARLLEAGAAAGVPVPAVRRVLRPEDQLGEGFVMDLITGETLGGKIVRDERFAPARKVLASQCGRALARAHRIPTAPLPPLRLSFALAELESLIALHRSHGMDRPVFEAAFRWLSRNAPPEPPAPSLVHGDFRNGNIIVGEDGLRAILDWEVAHLGDPMEDLGWISVNSWRFGNVDLPVGGFGTREDLFTGYEAEGGRVDRERVHYWEIMGTLKWGIVCESMAHSWLTGAEREVEKAAIGRRASESELDLLALLTAKRSS
jgi:aminoglycoside phosphotransferase (APT) family kinase protein